MILEKVTAFITEQAQNPTKLLVFRHPTAGIQVPAGTVEDGETIERAVLRETYEETGLVSTSIASKLSGTLSQNIADGRTVLLQAAPLLASPVLSAAPVVPLLKRGSWVKVIDTNSGWFHVAYTEYELQSDPPTVSFYAAGWVPSTVLASQVIRHFFHLVHTDPTPAQWIHLAEDQYHFQYQWLPLSPRPRLVEGQDEWLAMAYVQLVH